MLLAEISNPKTKYSRLETFAYQGEANKWVGYVFDTDIALMHADRADILITITDIPTGACLVQKDYRTWR